MGRFFFIVAAILIVCPAAGQPQVEFTNTCDGIMKFMVDGEGGFTNLPVAHQREVVLPPGTASIPISITLFTREWPTWERHSNLDALFRDVVQVRLTTWRGERFNQTIAMHPGAAVFGRAQGVPGGAVVVLNTNLDVHLETQGGPAILQMLISTVNRDDGLFGSGAKIEIAGGIGGGPSVVQHIVPMTSRTPGYRLSGDWHGRGDQLLLDDVMLRTDALKFLIVFSQPMTYGTLPPIYVNLSVPNGLTPSTNTWSQLFIGPQSAVFAENGTHLHVLLISA